MKLLALLLRSAKPRSLRELADLCQFSPGGVSDALRRLELAELVVSIRSGNKKLYKPTLSTDDTSLLETLLTQATRDSLRKRSELFSEQAKTLCDWIDPTAEKLRIVKSRVKNSVVRNGTT